MSQLASLAPLAAAILMVVLLGAFIVALLDALTRRLMRPPVSRRRLMTPAEVKFFKLLAATVPHRVVFGQVSMNALLRPADRVPAGRRMSVRNRFAQKVVDFAVLDRVSGDVLYLVELDDPSHFGRERADAQRDDMLAGGGYRVVRVPTRPWPTAASLRGLLGPLEDRAFVQRRGGW